MTDDRSGVQRRPSPTPSGAAPLTASELLKGAGGLAQVAAQTSWRLARWTAQASLASTTFVVDRAVAGESAGAIIQEAAQDVRAAAWKALGITGAPEQSTVDTERTTRVHGESELRRRGAELLRRSNDVHVPEATHPAFARILSEILPDEARVLRFLYLDGPQPSIDVRTNRPLGIGSELVAGGLSMIGEHAGCRHVEQINQYLINLQRLGLIEFSNEQVSNPQRYQVVEAQPKVVEAMRHAGRMPRVVHRSIHLNEFGRIFCQTCLPMTQPPVPGGRLTGRRPHDRPRPT